MKRIAILILAIVAAVGAATVTNRFIRSTPTVAAAPRTGEEIYRADCARCHGAMGEGVAGQSDEPLYGEKSVEALSRYIARSMPEDNPGTCIGPDADAVAAYLHDTFYSPQARARNQPPRIDLVRLTNRQYRESVADLIASFRPVSQATQAGGLDAEYFQSEGMNKKKESILKRPDRSVDFDFGEGSPTEGITADQFSIVWNGSLRAPDSGDYQFRITTPNGARLYFNTDLAAGDSNRRDDSGARRQPALIDLWVSSGGEMREGVAQMSLLGGRSYPLRLDYFKFKEKTAALKFEWKPPHGLWEVVPASVLSPEPSSSVPIVTTSFPADDASLGYERGTAVSKAWQESTAKAAVEAAGLVEARLNFLAGTEDGASNRVEALKTFCATFAERAFRRPLTPELQNVFVERQFATGVEPEVAVKRSVMLILNSPRFLYPELGDEDDYRVASRLALTLWDSLPDETLMAAAARGELSSPDPIREQALRMMADPRARAKLREFFHHWLAFDEAEDISKDPKAYPDFDEAVLIDLRHSLERFVDDVVWDDASNFRQLLLADYVYMNPRLAAFYGADVPPDDDFVPVKFEADRRAGILTHPFLLSMLSYHRSSSPIHRGVFLTRNVLGRFLKPPPMAIEFMDDRFDPSLTMREKVTELTGKPACMGCHATINPLGFSLEHYDAVGRFRTEDNRKPVDAESDYITAEGLTLKLRGPRDVAEHAADNPEARAGFVRQLFHHAVKQTPAAYGPETLAQLDAAFAASGTHIRNLLVEIAVIAAQPPAEAAAEGAPPAPRKTAARPTTTDRTENL